MENIANSALIAQELDVTLSSLVVQARELVVYVDYNWVIQYCNDVYLASVGMKREDVIGKTPFDYQPSFRRSIFWEMMDTCGRERKAAAKIGYSVVMNRWLMVRVFPLKDGALMLANDAAENFVRSHQLAEEAVKDGLTGLRNALGLASDMEALIKAKQPHLLLVLGLDRFRILNDALGHAGGDMALLEFTSRFQSTTVEGETLYRLSADEFAVVRKQGLTAFEGRFEAFQRVAEVPFTLYGQSFVLGLSGGYCKYPNDGDGSGEVLRRAGLALHRSKRAGGGQSYRYVQGLEAESVLRAQLESELRAAIKEDKLHLVYQPKGDLGSNSVIGAEALIRWNHPTRGLLSPAAFLPIAEDCRLMWDVDMLVLRHAVKAVAHWALCGVRCPISINLSTVSLADRRLIEEVTNVLAESGVNPNLLEVEIPEGALIRDVDTSLEILNALRAMGVHISVDDFGTGYSSFSYLARFPVQTLKVDRSFVANIDTNPVNHKIVKAIIRMAHSLQLDVVAEGAERTEEMAVLRKLHCNSVQGYFYSRPIGLPDFIRFVHAQNSRRNTINPFSN